jgi:hypothetical protein
MGPMTTCEAYFTKEEIRVHLQNLRSFALEKERLTQTPYQPRNARR